MHHDASRRGDGHGPTERDVLGQATDAIDEAIGQQPAGSPWRGKLARVSRVLRAAAGLPPVRAVGGGC